MKQMNAILSIKPQFVREIVAGRKIYEFRKKGFKKHVKKIYVYASSPICRIVGEFKLGQILEGKPEDIWTLTNKDAGISKEYFDDYYFNKEIAFALEIKSFIEYENPINPYKALSHFSPPQSFCYVGNELLEMNGNSVFS